MNEQDIKNTSYHSIVMENRKKLTLTGINDILSYDEESVGLMTDMGKAIIRGKNIRIESFKTESGDMEIEGKFDALVYLNDTGNKGGVIKKLFK